MTAEKKKKTEKKELQPHRSRGWLSPFEQMENLFEDFSRRPFGRPWWHAAPMPRWLEEIEPSPSVDIFEDKGDVVIKSELPGMTKDNIEVDLGDGTITLSGEKKKEEKVEKKDYFRHERSYGSFSRTFKLPADVQSDMAKASFKNGVLEVRIPKTEEARKKTKKVEIE